MRYQKNKNIANILRRLFSCKCCCLFSAFEIPPDKFSDCSKQENSCFFSDSDDLFMNFQKYILYFFWKSAIMIADSMLFYLKFLQINGRILRRNLHFIETKCHAEKMCFPSMVFYRSGFVPWYVLSLYALCQFQFCVFLILSWLVPAYRKKTSQLPFKYSPKRKKCREISTFSSIILASLTSIPRTQRGSIAPDWCQVCS